MQTGNNCVKYKNSDQNVSDYLLRLKDQKIYSDFQNNKNMLRK